MTPHANSESIIIKLALFIMGIGAAGMLMIKPLLVGGLIDSFHYTPRAAGLVAGIEMAGVGIGTLLVVLFGARWRNRMVAATGAAIGIAASIGPSLWTGFAAMAAIRFGAGIGAGVLVSVVIAAIALSRDPDRWFSLYYMASALAGTALFPLAAALIGAHGVRSGYLFLALLLLPVFPLLSLVPREKAAPRAELREGGRFPYGPAAISLSASVIYWIGSGAVWSFFERIGVAHGLTEQRIGNILALSEATFVLGALSASLLHTRIGRVIPATAGVLISLLSLALLHYARGEAGFVAGALLFTFGWMFFFPYLSGAMAAQDARGRVAVLGVPSQTLGLSLGPAIAGFLVSGTDYRRVLLLCAIAQVAAIIILVPALIALGRRHAQPDALAPMSVESMGVPTGP
jgi:predicted MFS family arabinose efflux permease